MPNSTVCVSDGLTEENMMTVSLGCVFTGNQRRNKETFISLTGNNNVFVSLSYSSTPYGCGCFSHAPEDEGTQSNHCSTLLSLKLYICVTNDVTKHLFVLFVFISHDKRLALCLSSLPSPHLCLHLGPPHTPPHGLSPQTVTHL